MINTIRRKYWAETLAIVILLLIISFLAIKGEDTIVTVHDYLDSTQAIYKITADEGFFFHGMKQ